jgi:hypothetical protein
MKKVTCHKSDHQYIYERLCDELLFYGLLFDKTDKMIRPQGKMKQGDKKLRRISLS